MSKKYRSAFAKFRSEVAPNHLETGRYEGVNGEHRLWKLCDQITVESEMHVIIFCPMYENVHIDNKPLNQVTVPKYLD